jgi:16S rRNA (cytosine967-C5)-methyltransferase
MPPTEDRHAAARRRARLAALQSVRAAVQEGYPADQALQRFLRGHPEFGSRDRRDLNQAVFSWFRWRGWLPERAEAASEDLDTALWLDEALAQDPAGGMEELAAAFATHVGRADPPAMGALFPEAVRSEPALTEATARALQRRPNTVLRLRPPQGEGLSAALQDAGLGPHRHDRLPQALSLAPSGRLQDILRRHPDAAEVQNLASQAVGLVCAPQPGQRWWDVCTGAGGKALHLQDLAANRLDVLGSDIRASILEEARRRQGARRLRWATLDPTRDPPPPGPFDGVLVDAPCSGLGTWARHPDARWRLPEGEVARLAALQCALLTAAARTVRPGGALIYAVCTFTEAETHGVRRDFSAAHPAFAPDPFPDPLDGSPTPGWTLIAPERAGGDAMFIARWRAFGLSTAPAPG